MPGAIARARALGMVLDGAALVAGRLLLYPRRREQVPDPRMQPTNPT